MARTIVTYWEGSVSWLERLSLASMQAAGHKVELYTYGADQLRAQGVGVDVYDVRDILPEVPPISTYREQGRLELYSDIVRLQLMRLGRGLWCDADCVLLDQLTDSADRYTMGWVDNGKRINNAVLGIPQDSELLEIYWKAATSLPVRAPWATFRVRMKREIGILFGRDMPGRLQKMSIGPRALTYFVRQLHLEHVVSPKSRFYPLIDVEAPALVDPDDRAAMAFMRADTQVVHAWRGMLNLRGKIGEHPPASSWAGQQCTKHGV